jgi:hypothetical protein
MASKQKWLKLRLPSGQYMYVQYSDDRKIGNFICKSTAFVDREALEAGERFSREVSNLGIKYAFQTEI